MSNTLTGPIVVLSTTEDKEDAVDIAEKLVEEQIAACVSVVKSVKSVYVWEGELRKEKECLLIIKTTGEVFDRLRNRMLELHPYETPELIAFPIAAGSEAYLGWLTGSVTSGT